MLKKKKKKTFHNSVNNHYHPIWIYENVKYPKVPK